MKRVVLGLMAAGLAGCVSGQNATNGAFRFINAVADSARMSLTVDEEVRAAGFDYTNGSSFIALRAGSYEIGLQETLPRIDTDDDGDVDSDDEENLYTVPLAGLANIDLDANVELTYIVAGSHGAEQVLAIEASTERVPTGQARVQVAHAAAGVAAVDVYIAAQDVEDVTGLVPFESGIGYLEAGDGRLRQAGAARLLITAAGDDEVLFDSGNIALELEGALLFAVVPNTGLDAGEFPVIVVLATGRGSVPLIDIRALGNYRFVNASSGAYTIDTFVTRLIPDPEADEGETPAAVCPATTVRQACPVTGNEAFLASYCALPYESIQTGFVAIEPNYTVDWPVLGSLPLANYCLKVQISDPSTLTVKNLQGSFIRGSQSTLVLNERPPTDATTSDVELDTFTTTRPIAPFGQLRLVTYSEGLDAAISGDPTTDRIDIFLTAEPGDPLDDDARFLFPSRRFGSDTGYVSILPGDYRLSIAKVDPEDEDDVPVVLYAADVTIAGGGVYTLIFGDSVAGILPVRVLSLEDDAGLTPVP
jgi:Domain of unknown function (DUF4397)